MKNQALFAFVGGAVLGAAVALLFAPEKGSVARKKIKKTLKAEKEKLAGMVDRLRSEVAEGREKLKALDAELEAEGK